jgi:uncharacterized protein YbjT (DUF2867 family)
MRQVIVTGGGTGIGRAAAAAFAGAGDEVVITGRRAGVLKETAAELGPRVRGVAFDAADPDQVEAALADLPEPGPTARPRPPSRPGTSAWPRTSGRTGSRPTSSRPASSTKRSSSAQG